MKCKVNNDDISIAFLLLGLMGILPLVLSKSSFEMAYDNCTCIAHDNKEYMQMLNCYVGKNAKRRAFYMEFRLNKEIKQYYINMLIALPRKGSDFVILNLTDINGCDILSNRNQVTLIKIGRQMLNRYSNFPEGCPFKKDSLYYIRGFRMDLSMLPAMAMETYMNVVMELIVNKRKLSTTFLQSHIYMKGNKNRGN